MVRLQVRPAPVQVLPVQQGWPSPPQTWQVSAPPPLAGGAHTVPAVVQRLLAQQRSPVLPQATHVSLLLHTVLPVVQRLFEQQGSFKPPQRLPPPSGTAPPSTTPAWHAPAEQVRLAPLPELAQAAPAAAQLPPPAVDVQQQPPALQRLPKQHSCPVPPQS